MNILLINAYGNNDSGKSKFNDFYSLVKNIFKKILKGSGLDNCKFICRTPNSIKDFLFKIDIMSGDVSQNLENKKNFDKIDIIFIDGKETYVPWEDKSYTLCEFIKLCKIKNKIMFMSGVAFEILIYYLATGTLNEYNFINSKGEIKAIEEMATIPYQLFKSLKRNDNFLDFVSGDILEFRPNEQIWAPIKNIGLHKQLTAEKYMYRGRFVLPDKFKGKDFIKNKFAFITICNEIKVSITRQNLSHYLVENLPLEFVVYSSLSWFPHFVNVSNKKFQYKIIGESEKGPIIIEHENTIGVGFHINIKFRDSVTLLENFIKNKFCVIRDKLFKFKNIDDEIYSDQSNKENKANHFKFMNTESNNKKTNKILGDNIYNHKFTNMDKVWSSLAFNRIKNVKNEAGHVGFGLNNRDMIFVEQNFVSQKPLYCGERRRMESLPEFRYKNENKRSNEFSLNKSSKKKYDTIQRRIMSSYKKKNKINLINNNRKKHILKLSDGFLEDTTLYNYQFNSKSRNDLNKKIRLKSANIFNKINKPIHKASTLANLSDVKVGLDFGMKRFKKKKKIYFNDRKVDFPHYVSKYPRLRSIEDNKISESNKNQIKSDFGSGKNGNFRILNLKDYSGNSHRLKTFV